ncbi:exostosin family [Cryptosporidium sp. chipmunk genotype I]|uniref:exostosin family n=1 Tax=Cryptosporidium sp. chipmunk genotype I TaxID=1280935 RepID=UPI00351A9E1F|nr:exostosin family [Cryptosporidium sp. chipmunk genotype I]
MKLPCNFLILLEFACMLIISGGVIIYLYIQEFPYRNNSRSFFLESHPQIDYLECNLSFDGNLNQIKLQNITKQNKDDATEICLSNEQIRIFSLTKNLRPRLSTNYSGYMGPWIEDGVFCNWIAQYSIKQVKACNESGPIPPVYIPIFWTSIQRNRVEFNVKKEWYNKSQNVLNSLNNETLYFTVLQDAEGFKKSKLKFMSMSNLIVFNAGGATTGFKQVPIPLIKGELQYEGLNAEKDIWLSSTIVKRHFPVRKKLFETFAYYNITDEILDKMNSFEMFGNNTKQFIHYQGDQFKQIIQRSTFHLCPRGFGRTSFRLYESVQLGTIPIYIWDDINWIPYGNLMERLGIIIHVSQIEDIFDILNSLSKDELRFKFEQIKKFKHWFTYLGITNYILKVIKRLPPDIISKQNIESKYLAL